jgi:hypothetical protein
LVYIYRKHGNQWQQEAVLQGGKNFGQSVSVSDNLAIVGHLGSGHGSGSATVYRFDGQTWQYDATLRSSLGFSCCNSVSIDDNVAMIGCPGYYEGPRQVYLFRRHREGWQEEALLTSSNAWVDPFGGQVEIDGDVALVNGPYGSNSVWVYRFDGTSWHHEAELLPSEDADNFGSTSSTFSTNGEYILVGARAVYNDLESEAVPAYLYRFDEERWQEVRQITASDGADGADLQKFGLFFRCCSVTKGLFEVLRQAAMICQIRGQLTCTHCRRAMARISSFHKARSTKNSKLSLS